MQPVLGNPLIYYTIKAATESKKITSFYVSSDNDEILNYSQNQGAKVHKRPEVISTDTSSVVLTVESILEWAEEKEGQKFDLIILLQPTSPLRSGKNIDESIQLLEKDHKANSLISVAIMNEIHPARMYKIKNQYLESLEPNLEKTRRQDIPSVYYRNGSIYLVRVDSFKRNKSLMTKPSIPYIMPLDTLLNIDEPRDLKIADVLMRNWLDGNP